jgi:hypothetical protein
MATTLQSPGVSVSVIDQSFYTPAAPGTVPMIFVTSKQNKSNASGTSTAQGTTKKNAGVIWTITSQRDLTETFGTPYFETDTNGNAINGSERNEYGLQTAYNLLGISSKVYVVRSDLDLDMLYPSTSIPVGMPVAGTYWVDTHASRFGVNVWSTTANNGAGGFTAVTPKIIDNSTTATSATFDGTVYTPKATFGAVGDYAMVVTSQNTNQLYFKTAGSGWTVVRNTFDGGKNVEVSANFDYPNYTSTGTTNGSVWVQTNAVGTGANWVVKYWNGNSESWTTVSTPIFASTVKANLALDPTGGGSKIPVGSLFIDADYNNGVTTNATAASFKLYRRSSSAATTVTVASNTTGSGGTFTLRESLVNGTWGTPVTLTVATGVVGEQIAQAINTNGGLVNTSAVWDSAINRLYIKHKLSGEIELTDSGSLLSGIGLVGDGTVANLYAAPTGDSATLLVSNWSPLMYEALAYEPATLPANGSLWFDSNIDVVDIMYNTGAAWEGYLNAFPTSDPMGPLVMASAPTTQSDGISALVRGDIWVDSSRPETYGKVIYVYDGNTWVLQDPTDHITPNGWVYADARWSDNGVDNTEYVTPIADMLVSNYVDPDAPDPRLYPRGTRLWNLRKSGNNVKQYVSGYINLHANGGYNQRTGESMTDYTTDRWVSVSPNDENHVGQFGRHAQRSVVVKSLKALVTANQSIRDTDTLNFNIIAAPGYPELITDMVNFNADIGQVALVVGDTPMRLTSNATTLANYGNNAAHAVENNDVAAVSYDNHLAMYYPSGFTNDNIGNNIVVPPSYMAIRTIIESDAVSYQWFAPAGTRRGIVHNASSVGYIDSTTGEFVTTSLYQGLRDTLASVKINPIATLPGVGLAVMGQYTRASASSSLDRINVARLVSFLRVQLGRLAKPFLFEPNDSQTRNEIKTAVESLLIELVSQRALYDFVVVCDSSNNTPTRIDRSELYVDIAIEPVKAVEFIYIPLRLLNTGAIASGNFGSQKTGSKTN